MKEKYIDVNRLKENLITEIYSYSKGDIRKRLFARGLSLAYDIVNRQPTVEPKHGHWVNDERGASGALGLFVICSECHRYSMGDFPYCPYCGAKMDEVSDEINN